MSEHLCHVSPGTISKARAAKADAVIRATIPGASGVVAAEGKVWVSLPAKGFPFDRAAEREVEAALRIAGLWPLARRS
jgi:hypothetical protein